MMFQGKPGEHMPLASGLDKSFWDGEWTLQCLINPNSGQDAVVMNMPGRFIVGIKNETLYFSNDNQTTKAITVNTNTYAGN